MNLSLGRGHGTLDGLRLVSLRREARVLRWRRLVVMKWRSWLGIDTLADLGLFMAVDSFVIGLAFSFRGSGGCAGPLEAVCAESWAA